MFDVRRFLKEHFQNPGGVVAHCRAAGLAPPNEGTAQKWFERGSLTGEWLATLLLALEHRHGGPISLRLFKGGAE
jgi:hypothetical protein